MSGVSQPKRYTARREVGRAEVGWKRTTAEIQCERANIPKRIGPQPVELTPWRGVEAQPTSKLFGERECGEGDRGESPITSL